jgi:hypothetical protein
LSSLDFFLGFLGYFFLRLYFPFLLGCQAWSDSFHHHHILKVIYPASSPLTSILLCLSAHQSKLLRHTSRISFVSDWWGRCCTTTTCWAALSTISTNRLRPLNPQPRLSAVPFPIKYAAVCKEVVAADLRARYDLAIANFVAQSDRTLYRL